MEEPFPERVKRLARERDLSVSKVSYMAYDPDVKGTTPDTLKSVMGGRRTLPVVLIEAVARVLQVPPDDFPEYRLAMARRSLDEREVGLEAALATLSQLESALDQQAQTAARGARPASEKSPRKPAARRAGRKSA